MGKIDIPMAYTCYWIRVIQRKRCLKKNAVWIYFVLHVVYHKLFTKGTFFESEFKVSICNSLLDVHNRTKSFLFYWLKQTFISNNNNGYLTTIRTFYNNWQMSNWKFSHTQFTHTSFGRLILCLELKQWLSVSPQWCKCYFIVNIIFG